HLAGEFPWAVAIGEQVKVDDSAAASKGMLLSIETTDGGKPQEINATVGYYLDSDEVYKGFSLEGQPPVKEWMAPHQPNPNEARREIHKSILLWATLTLMGLMGWSCARSGHHTQNFKLSTVPGTEPAAEHVYISEPFDLGKPGQQFGVEVELKS